MRILIVEDDLEAAEAMARGLTEAGHECTRGADGQEGLAAAQGGEFDVMIVDRMMPRMNGVELVETLRREGDHTPVLFLSALGEVDHRVEGLQAGGDDYLTKPYAPSELVARVEALGRRATGEGIGAAPEGSPGHVTGYVRVADVDATLGPGTFGMAEETVCRVFTRFQDDGLLTTERRQVRLLDQDRLKSLSLG